MIFLLLSQEASAKKTIGLGLFSLSLCIYASDPASSTCSRTWPRGPANVKHFQEKYGFHDPTRQISPAEKQPKLLLLKRRKKREWMFIAHPAFSARHCIRYSYLNILHSQTSLYKVKRNVLLLHERKLKLQLSSLPKVIYLTRWWLFFETSIFYFKACQHTQ